MTDQERRLWETIRRSLAAIDAAIVRYQLEQERDLPPRFTQLGPPDPLAARVWHQARGVKVD